MPTREPDGEVSFIPSMKKVQYWKENGDWIFKFELKDPDEQLVVAMEGDQNFPAEYIFMRDIQKPMIKRLIEHYAR